MKTQKQFTLTRLIMMITALIMIIGPIGGLPPTVTVAQSSFIVQAANTELAAQLVQSHGGEITSRLEIINAVAANLSAAEEAQLRLEKGIVAITPNGAVKSSDDGKPKKPEQKDNHENTSAAPATDFPNVVGADAVWEEGVTGSGVTVAVLDTGLGGDLPQLTQTTEKSKDSKGSKESKKQATRIVGWKDFIDNSSKPIDPNGHGSHVAGIIANSEKGLDGEYNGIAPNVNLAGVRVLDQTGAGTYETVISGLQWVIKNKERYNIRVVNLSLVSPVQSPYWADPLNQAVTATWASGVTVIAAAGNTGSDAMTITVPGNNPYVVTVGAFTDNYTPDDWSDDYIAPFSSAGPTLDGFSKPDLVAPGAHMVSVIPENSFLSTEYPGNTLGGNYFKLAGTSQATAAVSGIAALVLSKNSDLSPDQVKMRLTSTALPWIGSDENPAMYSMFQQGAGRPNAPEAVFSKDKDAANQGLDIRADLAGKVHYEGMAFYDETTGTYRLREPFDGSNDGYTTWDGKFGSWSGKFGSWSGKFGSWSGKFGSWSGKFGSWSGKFGSWSGKFGSWSGKFGSWSGKFGSWSGKFGSWSGGYTTWAGKFGSWSGSEPWAGSILSDPTFAGNFAAGVGPELSASSASISNYLLEP